VAESDPLEAIHELPPETQVAVVVSVLRSTRNTMGRIERKVDWVLRALWSLIATIVIGVVVYAVTSSGALRNNHPPATKQNDPAAITLIP
jgi:hypothetical protein